MGYRFKTAGTAFFGKNALESAESAIRALGNKALIVTGKVVTKTGMVDVLTEALDSWGIGYAIFNDLPGEPDDHMIKAGTAVYEKEGCDFLIGMGGGTPIDSAKAISLYSAYHKDFSSYMGVSVTGDLPPVAAIPTTAGTGSEATKFFCVTDTATDTKLLLGGDSLLPDVAIVDPEFTLSSPKSVTAATGMDALTHAVESYTSKKANPITDLYAKDAVRRIFSCLPAAYEDGHDKRAREQMALAAYEAGVCINNASVTLVHGMSRPIGAIFHVPHGISNAMIIGQCLDFALEGCPDRFADLGRVIGAAKEGDGPMQAGRAFIKAVERLAGELNIPTLSGYGIDREKFFAAMSDMADAALASGSPANTRRTVGKEDILRIYQALWQ